MKKVIVILTILILSSCSTTNKANSNKKVKEISLVTLISNPEKYHKKTIQVQGYFCYEHEGNAVYIGKTDWENLLFRNGVYLYITSDFLKSQGIEKPYRGYVSIEGVFNKDKRGSGGLFSGTFEEVTSIYRLYKRGGQNDELNIEKE